MGWKVKHRKKIVFIGGIEAWKQAGLFQARKGVLIKNKLISSLVLIFNILPSFPKCSFLSNILGMKQISGLQPPFRTH
jgi:hypothetical protein